MKKRKIAGWQAATILVILVGSLSFLGRPASATGVDEWVFADPIYNSQGQVIGWFCGGGCVSGGTCCRRVS